MNSVAYTLGVLDALVKSGEVSSAYATGVARVLEKYAGFMSDDSLQRMNAAAQKWINEHPGEQMTGDVAQKIFRDNRNNWWNFGSRGGVGTWAWMKNRIGANTTWMPGSRMTRKQYDRRLANAENEGDLGIIKDWESKGMQLHPQLAGALQDKHTEDAQYVEQDAKGYMNEDERAKAGFTEGTLANKFRTQAGDLAANGGAYDPKFFKSNKPDPTEPAYGKNLNPQFGANSDLAYRRGYTDPTAI